VTPRSTGKTLISVAWPGLLTYALLYGFVVVTGGRFVAISRDYAMSSLDRNILEADYFGTLLNAHIQPPLLNAVFGLTDRLAPPWSLTAIYAVLGALMVAGVATTLRLSGVKPAVCRAAGVLTGLLPTTLLYSFFPNTTVPVSFFAVLTLLGLAAIRKTVAWGTLLSALGVLGLFWTRSSFTWLFVIVWLGLLAIFVFREPKRQSRVAAFVVLGVSVGLVVATQGHYVMRFGIPTLSSWAGENLVNALRSSGLPEEHRGELAGTDPCREQLLSLGPFQPAASYTECVAARSPLITGHPILDQEYNGDPTYTLNYNYGARLSLARIWSGLAWDVISSDPFTLWRVAWGSQGQTGSVAIFFSRGEDHYEVFDDIRARAPVVWNSLGALSALAPGLGWLILATVWIVAIVPNFRRTMALNRVFWAGSALLISHAAVSIVGEYGENNRFRAEFDGVLIILATLGLVGLAQVLRSRHRTNTVSQGRR